MICSSHLPIVLCFLPRFEVRLPNFPLRSAWRASCPAFLDEGWKTFSFLGADATTAFPVFEGAISWRRVECCTVFGWSSWEDYAFLRRRMLTLLSTSSMSTRESDRITAAQQTLDSMSFLVCKLASILRLTSSSVRDITASQYPSG